MIGLLSQVRWEGNKLVRMKNLESAWHKAENRHYVHDDAGVAKSWSWSLFSGQRALSVKACATLHHHQVAGASRITGSFLCSEPWGLSQIPFQTELLEQNRYEVYLYLETTPILPLLQA